MSLLGNEAKNEMTSRRRFISILAAVLGSYVGKARSAPRDEVTFGLIRWDAWYKSGVITDKAQRNLADPMFSSRAPVNCRLTEHTLECIATQSDMDAEIVAASKAKIDYWAFVWTPNESALHAGFLLYQSSGLKSLVNWAAIISLGNLSARPFSEKSMEASTSQFAGLMSQPHYQRVFKDRPLLFLNWYSSEIETHFGGRLDDVKRAFDRLTEKLVTSGSGKPYVVVMAGDPHKSNAVRKMIGADAISNYIPAFKNRQGGTYQDLSAQAVAYWRAMLSTGSDVVIDAIVGWDTRPRHKLHDANYYALASPQEFARHLKTAIAFTRDYKDQCAAATILVYSWNECDEGGGVLPTLGDPSGKFMWTFSAAKKNI